VSQGIVLLLMALLWVLTAGDGAAAPAPSTAILSSPLAKIDIKDAEIEAVRDTPKGKLTIAQHYALDPGWLDPLEHQAAATQVVYDYLVHDAMIKPMPQGLYTYSLAERAELTADFTKAAFRLRPGLTFHEGQPLTTADVKWTYEHYKGVNFKIFQDKLDRIEIVDDRTIICHFKQPFVEFIDLYNGGTSGSVWILPQHYYEKVGREGFIAHPVGAGVVAPGVFRRPGTDHYFWARLRRRRSCPLQEVFNMVPRVTTTVRVARIRATAARIFTPFLSPM
jgi:ABC-type transport system substrate-binding protein